MKSDVCVVTVDASRARFFALEVTEESSNGRLTRLVEIEDLASPGRRQREGEIFSSSRPGVNSGPGGFTGRGVQHGTDDRRGDHIDEIDRRFAVDVIEGLGKHVTELGAERAVIVANPTMLGHLRNAMAKHGGNLKVEVSELKKDLSWQSPVDVQDRLAEEGLLPPRGRLHSARAQRQPTASARQS